MTVHQLLLGRLFYRPRHVRHTMRWRLPALLMIPPAVAVADTPIGMVAMSVAAAVTAVIVVVRWRLVRMAAQVEEIIETELAPHDVPPSVGGTATG
ncbi:hypothetical protein [Amycolatopsis sp. lyj-23]|uniref:hypothetical protein n=1 Tax=Amycolatopsis sp. lyj-23 TaxID=2789283 RepID=UPI00397DAC93